MNYQSRQDANDFQRRVRGINMRSVEKMVDNNGLTIEAPGSLREPNGRTKKEGSACASRRGSRGQNSSRPYADHEGAGRCK